MQHRGRRCATEPSCYRVCGSFLLGLGTNVLQAFGAAMFCVEGNRMFESLQSESVGQCAIVEDGRKRSVEV